MPHTSRITNLLIPTLLLLPFAWALLTPGLPNTADMPVHVIRPIEIFHAWQDGIWFPRWSANLGYGYGLPIFNYIPQLPYLITAFFYVLGLQIETALKGMLLLSLFLASFGSYWMGRRSFGPFAGAICAAAYLYAPIRLHVLFIQGNAAQFFAWALLPWAFGGLIYFFETGKLRYGILVALSLAGTLLSHNVVSLMLGVYLCLLGLMLVGYTFLRTKEINQAIFSDHSAWLRSSKALMYGVLGLALSAWVWVPALLETKFVHSSRIMANDFSRYFVPFSDLIALSPLLDRSTINPYYPLTLGAVQLTLAGMGLLGAIFYGIQYIRSTSAHRGLSSSSSLLVVKTLFWGITFFTCAFMALESSQPLWENLPLVRFFQFPARWHGLTILALSWLAGLAVYLAGRRSLLLQRVFGTVALFLLIGSSLVNLYPHRLPPNMYHVTPQEPVKFEVRTKNVGTMSFSEFNPIWVQDSLYDSPLVANYLANEPLERIDLATLPPEGQAVVLDSSTQAHRFAMNLPTPTDLLLRLHYFPGWEATIDNEPITIRPASGSGLMSLSLPMGEYELALRFRETPVRFTANIVSIIGWLILGIMLTRRVLTPYQIKSSNNFDNAIKREEFEIYYPLAETVLIVTIVMILYLGVPHWFFTASPVNQALPASQPLEVDWQDKLRLLGTDELPTVVRAGDEISLVAYWRALPDLEQDYSVFLHLDDVNGQTIASVDQQNPSDIATSDWPTAFYVRNNLKLQIPADSDPIRYRLRVGFYDKQTKTPLPVASTGEPFFEVGQIWVEPRNNVSTSTGVEAQFGEHIHLQSATYDEKTGEIKLYWHSSTAISEEYSIFVHLRDQEGSIIGQLDGTPYQNRYRTSDWRPQQLIEDIRSIPDVLSDPTQVDQIAIGVYSPVTGERLLTTNTEGKPLADNMLLIDVMTNH